MGWVRAGGWAEFACQRQLASRREVAVRGHRHAGGPEYRGPAADRPGRWTRGISRPVSATPHMARRHSLVCPRDPARPDRLGGRPVHAVDPVSAPHRRRQSGRRSRRFRGSGHDHLRRDRLDGIRGALAEASSQRADDRTDCRRPVGTVAPPATGLRQRYLCRRNSAARVPDAVSLRGCRKPDRVPDSHGLAVTIVPAACS